MKIDKIIGYILLSPALISVFLFLLQWVGIDTLDVFLRSAWTGVAGDGGYTSALPLYFGLMAIAGVLLISNSNKK